MTVNTNLSRVQYNGNGVTTAFTFGNRVTDASQLAATRTVTATGAVTDLILNDAGANGFSVSGVPGSSVTVNTVAAPATGTYITIYYNMPLTQTADYVPNDPFPAETHEGALDKLTIINQQSQDAINRSLKFPASASTALSPELPIVPVADAALAWDGATGKVKNGPATTDIANAASNATAAAASAAAAAASAAAAAVFNPASVAITGGSITGITDLAVADGGTGSSTAAGARANLGAAASGANADITSMTALASINGGQIAGNRNAIINGAMEIWQRGTSFAAAASGQYSADRFVYYKVGAMVHTLSRSSDVPTPAQAGRFFQYSLLADCTTVDSSIAAGDYCVIQQRIEGFNFAALAQRALTLSFWVKATKTGTYCVGFGNTGADRTYVGTYTINAADTWEFKTISVAASPSAGTWDFANGTGLIVAFVLAAGSTFHTTAGAWQTGNFVSTSGQVNACDSTSNDFRIVGVQLEAGAVATPFENRSFATEFAACLRYYEKSYPYATAPGTSESSYPTDFGLALNNTFLYCGRVFFNQHKRSAGGTIKPYSTDGTIDTIRDTSAGANRSATASYASEKGFTVTTPAAMTTNNYHLGHWTADYEL